MDGKHIIVHVNGTIQAAILSEGDHVFVRAHFTYGADWSIISGPEQILSQVAVHMAPHGAVFNMPIDVCFRTTNLHGWPRLVLSIYGENGLQSMFQSRPVPIPIGHGSCLLPISPGKHTRSVALFRPLARSQGPLAFLEWLLRPLTGDYPDYFDSRFVGQGDSRMVTRVESTGDISIDFNVASTGLTANGYCVSGQPVVEMNPRAPVPNGGSGFVGGGAAGGGGFNSTILGRSFGAASP